jgi:hypothetical protein
MPIKNMGTATMRFNEGIICSGSATSPSLEVYHNLSSEYVAVINNDAGSQGHGLKVTTDGTGTGTTILDLEAGSTTVFKVRGDGRVGIGVGTPGSTLSVDDEIAVGEKLIHRGDPDTYLMFDDDELHLAAGGRTFLKLEEASTDKLIVNHGGLDIDLQVKGENDANLVRTDAENDSIYFGASSGAGVDNNFFVSGSISSKGTGTRGTAVFGGDAVVSGSLHVMGGDTFGGATTAAIILDSSTASKIVWDSEDDGNSPDASVYESGGSLYLSSSNDIRIYAGTDDILLFPRDMLQVIEDENASGNFASFFAQPSDNTFYNVLDIGDTGVVINDDSRADYDFRVETDGDSNMFFVDAGNNKVGVSTGMPHSGFHMNTSVAFPIRTITQDHTVTITDHTIFVNAAASNIDVTLPTAANIAGRQYIIKRVDAAGTAVSIQTDGSETIDGASSAALTDKRSVIIQSDNNNWWIVSEYISPP